MIEVRDLSVWYGDLQVLEDLSFEVAKGECLLITGPSGCGKSTLSRALSGLIPHAVPARIKGSVKVAGLETQKTDLPNLAQSVGVVFQTPSSQLFHLRVEDEVAFGLINLGLSAEEVIKRVNWALSVIGMEELRNHKPADLSGGQKQKLAIASALAMQPKVLVLDEPTASLDVIGSHQVVDSLDKLREELGLTVVIIEHRLAEVARLVQRIFVMEQGRVVIEGDFHQVLNDPCVLDRYGLRRPVETSTAPWQTLLEPNGTPPQGVSPLLELTNVVAGYNGQAVLDGLDLSLYPGEFVALVGDNGAGKTTLALAAAGLLKPKQGQVHFDGRRKPRPGLDIALLFQNPLDQLFTDSVDEEVAFAPRNYKRFDPKVHQQTLEEADLELLRERSPLALSVGQQQRTALAACLSLRPRLLILDEPTLGQDWKHLQGMMEFLQHLNALGTTVLLITHDFKLVHRYADRVVLIDKGHVVLDGRVPKEGIYDDK